MRFRDLKDLDKDDILAVLGLETRQSTASWVVGSVGLFGLGLLVGASTALLLTPKTGPQLREDLTTRINNLSQREASGSAQSLQGV